MKADHYPINGFAPGHYSNTCVACDLEFEGAKMSLSCEPCAMELLEKSAEAFAREMHVGQAYGEQDYVDSHVVTVVGILRYFGFDAFYLAAGWLHDVIEDTDATKADVERKFGPRVASLVWACTGIGKNRRERNASIYEKIAAYPDAAIVKVADRIANVEASDPQSGHRQMYLKERDTFHHNVCLHVPKRMLERLALAYDS